MVKVMGRVKALLTPIFLPLLLAACAAGPRGSIQRVHYWDGEIAEEREFKEGKLVRTSRFSRKGVLEVRSELDREGVLRAEGFYPNWKRHFEWSLKDGAFVGVSRYWHPNGVLALEERFEGGRVEGPWTLYRDNGQVWASGRYQGGRPVGSWVEVDSRGKRGARHFEFGSPPTCELDGVEEGAEPPFGLRWSCTHSSTLAGDRGTIKRFYPNGRIHTQGGFARLGAASVADGIVKDWYLNGALRSEHRFRNGRAEGAAKTYYANGRVESVGSYEDGQATDAWAYYREDGSLEPKRLPAPTHEPPDDGLMNRLNAAVLLRPASLIGTPRVLFERGVGGNLSFGYVLTNRWRLDYLTWNLDVDAVGSSIFGWHTDLLVGAQLRVTGEEAVGTGVTARVGFGATYSMFRALSSAAGTQLGFPDVYVWNVPVEGVVRWTFVQGPRLRVAAELSGRYFVIDSPLKWQGALSLVIGMRSSAL